MKVEPDKPVKVIVTYSKCPLLKSGDVTYLRGPSIDHRNSTRTCATAFIGVYPWIMASRFGIESKNMEWNHGYHVWCPEKLVKFKVETVDDKNEGKKRRRRKQ